MDRREFLKICGALPILGAICHIRPPETIPSDIKWGDDDYGVIDLGDEIIDFVHYKDDMLVLCKHSVWRLYDTFHGPAAELIKCNNDFSSQLGRIA